MLIIRQVKMLMITILLVAVSLTGTVDSQQLPCDSFLRAVLPELFTHCSSCFYGSWGSWTKTGRPLSNPNCQTGRSFKEYRTRKGGDNCMQTQNRTTCEPSLQEQIKLFIEALNLGSTPAVKILSEILQGRFIYNVADNANLHTNSTDYAKRRSISAICRSSSTEICPKTQHKRRRFGGKVVGMGDATNEPLQLDENSTPESFDIEGHLTDIRKHNYHRYKRGETKKRYVLLILDTSGSIGKENFELMTETLSKLVPLFCGYTKFGVMTFGDKIQRDICFNCNQEDRTKLKAAISSITYRKGPTTRSGDAIRCACDKILQRTCGYYDEDNALIDVIFITDGHSNSGENVCTATNCFNDFGGKVGVVSIGVGDNVDLDELECIKGDNAAISHIFDVGNLRGLVTLQEGVLKQLKEGKKLCQKCC